MADESTFDVAGVADAFGALDFEGHEDEQDTEPDDTAPTQADEEPAAEEEARPDGWKDEGPGDVKAALRQARAEASAAKAQAQAVQQQLALFHQQQQAHAAQQQQAAQRQAIQQRIEDMDPEDVPAYLEQVQQHQAAELQGQLQQRAAWDRLGQSETFARASFNDYDAQIGKLTAAMGVEAVANWAIQQANPALAAYQAAKGFFTQSELDAAREAGRAEALEGLAARTQPRKHMSAPRLGNVPQAAPSKSPDPLARYEKRLNGGGDVTGVVSDLFAQALR